MQVTRPVTLRRERSERVVEVKRCDPPRKRSAKRLLPRLRPLVLGAANNQRRRQRSSSAIDAAKEITTTTRQRSPANRSPPGKTLASSFRQRPPPIVMHTNIQALRKRKLAPSPSPRQDPTSALVHSQEGCVRRQSAGQVSGIAVEDEPERHGQKHNLGPMRVPRRSSETRETRYEPRRAYDTGRTTTGVISREIQEINRTNK